MGTVFPRTDDGSAVPPVQTAWTHQPTDGLITAISFRRWRFLYRASGAADSWERQTYDVAMDTITLLWVFPTGARPAGTDPRADGRRVVGTDWRSRRKRTATRYVHPKATRTRRQPFAADTDSIQTVATSTSPVGYSGGALDGVIGGTTFHQPRAFTVSLSGNVGAFIDRSVVTVTRSKRSQPNVYGHHREFRQARSPLRSRPRIRFSKSCRGWRGRANGRHRPCGLAGTPIEGRLGWF